MVVCNDQRMRIAVLSKADASGGGASRIATELVDQLLAAGYHADHWTARQYSPADHRLHPLYGNQSVRNIAIRFGHLLLRKVGAPELWPIERLNPALSALRSYDILHAHDITNALAVQTLAWLARYRPLVWTLHDCSPFTGGCLNPQTCVRFRDHCGRCPQQGIWPLQGLFDFTAPMLARKRRFAATTRFTPLAPSGWMADLAASSGFFPRPRVVSNGIDLSVFRPIPKDQARQRLDLPKDRPLIAICSSHLGDVRKGTRIAFDLARTARDCSPLVLAIGRRDATIQQDFSALDTRFSSYLTDRAILALWCSAADLMLYCSLADNQPLTVMEAMACGTPVIGFATGGIPELVDQDENGWLAPTGDVPALSKQILDILGDRGRLQRWSEAAAAKAAREFGWERSLAAHIALYQSLLGVNRSTGNTSDR